MNKKINLEPDEQLTQHEPIPLVPEKMEPNAFPIDALGPVLAPAARAIIDCIQCPPALAGQSVLMASSMVAQAHGNVNRGDTTIPLTLFGLTVLESGERKSAADKWALKQIKVFENLRSKEYIEEAKIYEKTKAAYEIKRKSVEKKKHLSQSDIFSELSGLVEPTPPTRPQLLLEEPTLEAIQKGFINGEPSQGLFSDEGGQFFGGHAMSKENATKSAAGLSKFWDGDAIKRNRATEGESLMLFNRRLAIHFMIQPVIAETVIHDALLQGQGLLPRFLVAWPSGTAGSRYYKESNPHNDERLKIYWQRHDDLLNAPLQISNDGGIEFNTIQISKSAKQSWVAVFNKIEKQINQNQTNNNKAMLSKLAENILRIAGVLYVIDKDSSGFISEEHMANAILLGQYYASEAHRISQSIVPEEKFKQAKELLDFINKKELKEFPLAYLATSGPNKLRKSNLLRDLLKILEDHHYIRPIPNGITSNGKNFREAWRVLNV